MGYLFLKNKVTSFNIMIIKFQTYLLHLTQKIKLQNNNLKFTAAKNNLILKIK
ncbi:hypothetical protein NU08_3245 [Flavobacterium anhuiense]|uniref:Uncharacterized protein n=1 Tax=Flavobacterium anhuiense TaxID=459526 RepID=A0A444VW81_9FLAO|nr:hypothetical protein NU08_3245 [Flavobacterium anhuiense]